MLDVRAAFEDQRWCPMPSQTRAPRGPQAERGAGSLPILVVLFAVLFNAGLAIVNGHVMHLTASAVIGAEVSVVLAAHALILSNYRPQMLPWYALIVVVVLFSLERSAVVGNFDPKFMRDVLLIPTFVLLGMTTPKERLTTMVVVLHVIVVGGVLYEALFTQSYSDLFDVRQYYIATRPFVATDFWNSNSDLFVSATRPAERFFNFVDLHRISSVFLEPVSLGNYVVIITAFICASYRQLSWKVLAFLVVGNLIALVGCDGRLATVSSAIIILVTLAAPWLPQRSAVLYLPITLVCAVLFVAAMHPNPAEDNFPGRVAYCIQLLSRYDILEWFGNSDRLIGPAEDSGFAYTIATQSVIGLVAFWIFLVCNAEQRMLQQVKYLHAICIYIVLTMLVSYSLFSIKTAALLWFIYGSLQMAPALKTSTARARASPKRRGSGMRWHLGTRPI
jgi:putative polymerase